MQSKTSSIIVSSDVGGLAGSACLGCTFALSFLGQSSGSARRQLLPNRGHSPSSGCIQTLVTVGGVSKSVGVADDSIATFSSLHVQMYVLSHATTMHSHFGRQKGSDESCEISCSV